MPIVISVDTLFISTIDTYVYEYRLVLIIINLEIYHFRSNAELNWYQHDEFNLNLLSVLDKDEISNTQNVLLAAAGNVERKPLFRYDVPMWLCVFIRIVWKSHELFCYVLYGRHYCDLTLFYLIKYEYKIFC